MRSTRSPIVFLVLLPLLALGAGWSLRGSYERQTWQSGAPLMVLSSGSGDVLADPAQTTDLSLLWNVWRLLQRHYIAPAELQTSKMMEGAVRGLVAGIGDPYTSFMPPVENAEFHRALEGTLQGIGAELTLEEGSVTVITPLRGSPAEKAGLLPRDVIVQVDGQILDGLSLNDVVSRIRGRKGTKVSLAVVREDAPQPLSFEIERDNISVPSVEWKILEASGSQIGYVALNQFGDHSMREVRDALRQMEGKRLKGLVLDLRGNGGGYLDGAIELTSMFLREGEAVAVETRGKGMQRQAVSGRPVLPVLPMAVLINQASASASEIVAGALQDHGRATVVGMTSFGKGTVQEVIDLPGGGSLRVTTARWYTPKGRNITKEGITPDVVIERAEGDLIGKKDAQLERALQVLLGKSQ